MTNQLEIDFPSKMHFLLSSPARYKVLYGGRGGGKTESIALALVILAKCKRLRILCLREFQNSIKDSVHSTIKSWIYTLNLQDEFDVQATTIIHKITGSEFLFYGLRYNVDSIKSLSRIDIAWVEEAANVSKTSWDKLIPTIRGRSKDDPSGMGGPFGKGPEIWVSFNPDLDTDETYVRFILKQNQYAPDFIEENGVKQRYAYVTKINYYDNKWFPEDLRREMQILKNSDENSWLHVWEGHTKQTIDGAIYAQEVKKVLLEGRRGRVPYDPSRPVYTAWDLGHGDMTTIWFVQTVGMEYNLIDYYENRLQKMQHYIKVLQDKGYVYSTHYLPHDGDAETLTNISAKNQLIKSGQKVIIVPRVAKKIHGIQAARTVFDLCNFDEEKTKDGWQCLCRYQYKVDDRGLFSKEPDHNEYSHGADGFQTFALSIKSEQGSKKEKHKTVKETNVVSLKSLNTGWMA